MRDNVLPVSKINRSSFISRSLAAECEPVSLHYFLFPAAVGGFAGPDKVPPSFSHTGPDSFRDYSQRLEIAPSILSGTARNPRREPGI